MSNKVYGKIDVDTGRILIIDPANISDLTADDLLYSGYVRELNHSFNQMPGKGVLIERVGFGDGTYKIEVETFQSDDGFKRIKSLKINFVQESTSPLVEQWKALNKRHNQINKWYGQVYGGPDVGEEDFSEQPLAIASVSRLLEVLLDDIMAQKSSLLSRMTEDEIEQTL